MQKQVHVNAYVKKDGTQVKEHFRNIESNSLNNYDYQNNPINEQYSNLPENNSIGDTFSKIGETLKTVLVIGAELAPIAIKIYQAMKKDDNNGQNIEYLKPQFDTQIKRFDTQVEQIKYDVDNSVKNLVNTKNQKEYLEKYKKLEKLWQTYQQVSNLLSRIKTYAKNSDYKQVINELENFTKDNFAQINNINSNNNVEDKMTLNENIINMAGKIISPHLKVAGANLQNAMNDFEYARKNKHAYILNSRKEILNTELNNLMDNVGIPQDARGVIYDNNSEQSKLLWQSPEIQDFVKNNLQDLISGKAKEVYDVEFIVKGNLEGLDNFLGLQHCKLFNPQITPNGYFMGIIIDYYDFEKRKYTGDIEKDSFIYINNWGYSLQQKEYLENQFNIYILLEKLW